MKEKCGNLSNRLPIFLEKSKKALNDFTQKIYITILTFIDNDLLTIASAGAYNFLMSVVPILILTITILIRVLKKSPEEIRILFEKIPMLSNSFNFDTVFSSLSNLTEFSYLEIVIGVFILWMARRFFASIQHAMRKVYKKKLKIEILKISMIVIIGEIIVVNFFVFLFIFFSAGNALFNSSVIQEIFKRGILGYHGLTDNIVFLLKLFFKITPFIFMHLFIFGVYYFMPPVKPSKKNAYFSALFCTIAYFFIKILFALFRNTTKFTIVYGFFSNTILLLIQVWFFFFFFNFFAQFMYVIQFFKSFIISQLYRLPKDTDPGFLPKLERLIFIEPPKEYRKSALSFKKGEIIFKDNEESSDIFYVIEGTVRIISSSDSNKFIDLEKGSSFGEFACLLNGRRIDTAVAQENCLLAVVSEKEFLETLEIDGAVSRQALKILSNHLIQKQ